MTIATSIGKLPYAYEFAADPVVSDGLLLCTIQIYDSDGNLRYLSDGAGGVTDRWTIKLASVDNDVLRLFEDLVREKVMETQLLEAGNAIAFVMSMRAQGYRRAL